ncbi:hypothetical protein B0T16DRAFT_114981 [Cercophora newfieldiana]|uniref:Uncharacterized protein n=1 Tax=Cercophora newfieldiana TaxID=92897 RepID=A0AA40CRV3_9PEZI|nr:hypothetical protein B0T16DRAFT_114981 [Cercophora newfieldiana]
MRLPFIMKMLLCLAVLAQLLLPHVAAEIFWIYNTFTDGTNPTIKGQKFAFFHLDKYRPSCEEILNVHEIYPLADDASSDWVCACDGKGCLWDNRNPFEMDRFEWHASWGHYTYYKNRGGKFYDVIDREWGYCEPVTLYPPGNYTKCTWPHSAEPTSRLAAATFRCNATVTMWTSSQAAAVGGGDGQ